MDREDPRKRWGVQRCGFWANAMMLWAGTRVLWITYFFVWFAAAWFFLFAPRARRASMGYLDRLRPGRSAVRRSFETYRHMVVYGYLLLDKALMLTKVGHGFSVECEGRPHLAQAVTEGGGGGGGGGVMLFTGHFGNAEAVAPNMQKLGLTGKINLVMYQDAADATEKFHKRYRHLLEKIHVINTTDPLAAGIKIIAALRRGEVVALRADRRMAGKTVAVKLLGAKVELPAGPFLAAALSGAAVVQVYTCRLGYRRYACSISKAQRYGEEAGGTRDERVATAAQDFAEHLEEIVQRYPYQWGNFFDLWAP